MLLHMCLKTMAYVCKTVHNCNSASRTENTQRECLDSHAVLNFRAFLIYMNVQRLGVTVYNNRHS